VSLTDTVVGPAITAFVTSLAALIATQRAEHGIPVAVACRALGVSQAWCHKWGQGRSVSASATAGGVGGHRDRRHSTNGMLSPADYEQACATPRATEQGIDGPADLSAA
jgi:hypothetical protein